MNTLAEYVEHVLSTNYSDENYTKVFDTPERMIYDFPELNILIIFYKRDTTFRATVVSKDKKK